MRVEWNSFKKFTEDRNLSIQWVELSESYWLTAIDGGLKMECVLDKTPSDTTYLDDFINNFKDSGNMPYGNGKHTIYAPTFEWDEDLSGRWKGQRYTATAGVLNIFDEEVTVELKLRGGWYELLQDPSTPKATDQDYVEFSIVDKDDVLGLFDTYGLTVGVDVLEVSKFVVKDYVNPHSNQRQHFSANSVSNVVTGLYMRTYYYSAGSEDVTFKRVVHYYE